MGNYVASERRTANGERRRRLKRPLGLRIVAWSLILFAPLQMLAAGLMLQYPITELYRALWHFSPIGFLCTLLAPAVGVAVLQVQRYGWYAVIIFSVALLADNLYFLAARGNTYAWGSLFRAAVAAGCLLYFLGRDIYSPFLALYVRGWRSGRRIPVESSAILNGRTVPLRDVGRRGCYVEINDALHQPGEAVEIDVQFNGWRFVGRAGVVRVDSSGLGLAFRGTPVAVSSKEVPA